MQAEKEPIVSSNDHNVSITFNREILNRPDPEQPMNKVYLYQVNYNDSDRVKVVIPNEPKEDEYNPNKIPRWCKKQIRGDKVVWRQLHSTIKKYPKYAPEYFAPLPEVEKYQLKNTSNYFIDESNSNQS